MTCFVNLTHATLAEHFDNDVVTQDQPFPASARKRPCLVRGQGIVFDQLFGERVSVLGRACDDESVQFLFVDQAAFSQTVDKGFEILSLWFGSNPRIRESPSTEFEFGDAPTFNASVISRASCGSSFFEAATAPRRTAPIRPSVSLAISSDRFWQRSQRARCSAISSALDSSKAPET
jgi:hypothetical protein